MRSLRCIMELVFSSFSFQVGLWLLRSLMDFGLHFHSWLCNFGACRISHCLFLHPHIPFQSLSLSLFLLSYVLCAFLLTPLLFGLCLCSFLCAASRVLSFRSSISFLCLLLSSLSGSSSPLSLLTWAGFKAPPLQSGGPS